MTVLIVIAMFIVFLTIDYFYSKKRALAPVVHEEEARPRLVPEVVAGFALPANLNYHPGHMWAVSEAATKVRVGLDDFAARLIGKAEKIELPLRGKWIRQGQKIVTVQRDGGKAELVSPIEGMVTDINDAVLADPEAARRDPYGAGWLLTVDSPDAGTNFRNLLSGTIARRWMEEAAKRLRGLIPAMAPAMAQDGGLTVDDLSAHLPEEKWTEATREFFLS